MSTHTLYFAYGSNMVTKRLRSRIGSSKPVGRAFVKGKKMIFNKLGQDGSGKANLVENPTETTWGVLYEIKPEDFQTLDGIEVGYNLVPVKVYKSKENYVTSMTYISEEITDDARPYQGYKDIVVSGAREHSLPPEYISYLEQLPSKPDSGK